MRNGLIATIEQLIANQCQYRMRALHPREAMSSLGSSSRSDDESDASLVEDLVLHHHVSQNRSRQIKTVYVSWEQDGTEHA